ncbi:Transposable element tcb2 transposase, partial [Caligus rogercresseyi]
MFPWSSGPKPSKHHGVGGHLQQWVSHAPHFFGPKEKVNTEVYHNVFKTVVVPWMNSVGSWTPYTFQQDSVPAHKAKLVQSWLKKNVSNFWDFNTWAPQRPRPS